MKKEEMLRKVNNTNTKKDSDHLLGEIVTNTFDILKEEAQGTSQKGMTLDYLFKVREKVEADFLKVNRKLDSSELDDILRKFLSDPFATIKYIFKNVEPQRGDTASRNAIIYLNGLEEAANIRQADLTNNWKEKCYEDAKNFNKEFNYKLPNQPEKIDLAGGIERNKGGFFENFFRTTSDEYKDLVKYIKDFQTKGNPRYGDVSGLKSYANAYLEHKLPAFSAKNNNGNYYGYDKLDKTGKGRVDFCKAIVAACQKVEDADDALYIQKEEPKPYIENAILDDPELNEDLNLTLDSANVSIIDDIKDDEEMMTKEELDEIGEGFGK